MSTHEHAWWNPHPRIAIPCPPDIEALLGTMADRTLGEHAGVSTATIGKWRKARNIAPFQAARPCHNIVPRASRPSTAARSIDEIMAATPSAHRCARREIT